MYRVSECDRVRKQKESLDYVYSEIISIFLVGQPPLMDLHEQAFSSSVWNQNREKPRLFPVLILYPSSLSLDGSLRYSELFKMLIL